jgi:hypothetical protein
MATDYQIAAYYFPNYHADPQNERWHGRGWTEWELVQDARPRFPGHRQPRVPLWGYEDESDPKVMNRKIAAAADHGIGVFVFDWYWHEEGPFLSGALDRGFLRAADNSRIQFALMWANHDWVDIHPALRNGPYNVLRRGELSSEAFFQAAQHVIQSYFPHPSYWRLDGGLYFSIYDLGKLIGTFGSVERAADGLRRFRGMVDKAGLGSVHLNGVLWSQILLPGEKKTNGHEHTIAHLGFDSVTHYVWLHHQPLSSFPLTPYPRYRDKAIGDWAEYSKRYRVPYIPNLTVGWDSSPRTVQSDVYDWLGYPFLPVLADNSPAAFRQGLKMARAYLETSRVKVLTVNAWNEWTEGSYLEPDTVDGMGYLQAVKEVFLDGK